MTVRLADLRSSLQSTQNSEFVGGIYPRRQLSLISSAPGLGKTWLILKQALDMVNGDDVFLAEECKPSRTLILCGESGENILAERIRLMGYDTSSLPEGFIIYTQENFAKAGINICLDEPDGMENFRKIIAGEKPDIVFIDTLISFRKDDENASKETARMLNRLRAIANNYNCAIVIMHHVRKRKLRDKWLEATQDEVIGTSAFTRLTACVFMLAEIPSSRSIQFVCVKSWYKKPSPRFWQIDNLPNGMINLVEVNDAGASESTFKKRAEDYINSMYAITSFSRESLQEETGCSKATAQRLINHYLERGVIEKCWEQGNIPFYRKKRE